MVLVIDQIIIPENKYLDQEEKKVQYLERKQDRLRRGNSAEEGRNGLARHVLTLVELLIIEQSSQ